MEMEPPRAIILAKFGSEIEVVDVLPKGSSFKADPTTLARSFPLSASGGEVVVFESSEGNWISSMTLKLKSEGPRPLLVSIIAVYPDRDSVVTSVAKFLNLRDRIREMKEITVERLKELLPSIASTLAGSDEELNARSEVRRAGGSRIVKKGYMFFVGGG